jgi:hypothetical protein
MLLRYLYTISKLCASISNFVFFDISVSLSDPAWAAVAPALYWTSGCAHCIVNQSSPVAHAPPGPPSAAAVEAALGGAAAAPATAPAAAAGAHSDQQSTSAGPIGAALGPADSSRVCQAEPGSTFHSHCARRGGQQGSRRDVLCGVHALFTYRRKNIRYRISFNIEL